MTIVIPLWGLLAFTVGMWVIILLKIAVEIMQYRVHRLERKNSVYDEALRLLDEHAAKLNAGESQ